MTQKNSQPLPGGGFFYGWYVVIAVFVMLTVAAGLGFHNLSVYLHVFVAERGFSVTAASGATAAFFVSSGIAGLGIAGLIERYDPRWVICGGALIAGITFACAGLVEELWQLYAFYLSLGVGYAGCALVPGTTLVARWFSRRRATALSYASLGLSLGAVIFTPISVKLIETFGLEAGSQWIGTMFFIGVVPLTLWLIRPSPASVGLTLEDAPEPIAANALHAAEGLPFDYAVRSRFFILCTIAYVFSMTAQVGGIAHQFNLISTRTGSLETAALAVVIMASAGTAGRLLGGWILTYMPSKLFTQLLLAMQVTSLASYAVSESSWALLSMAALFGLTMGNLLLMQSLLIAEAFGIRFYARLFSWSQLAITVGMAAGPALIGLVYDISGGYTVSYLAAASASATGLVVLSLAGPVDRPAADFEKARLKGGDGHSSSEEIIS